MIPTILLPALVIGRWWTVPAAAVVWVTVLLATGTIGAGAIPAAAAFAAANAVVGVALHQGLRLVVRATR